MDRNQFEVWLRTRPQEHATLIAARSAVRVLPIVMHEIEATEQREKVVLLTARAALLSGLSANVSSTEIDAMRTAVSNTIAQLTSFIRAETRSTARATARAADSSRAAVQTEDRNIGASRAISRAVDAAARFIDAARYADQAKSAALATEMAALKDANVDFESLFAKPLWHDKGEPRWLEERLEGTQNLLKTGPQWEFWSRWYRGFLNGAHLDWELQRRVALIEEKIWEDGPEAVAAEIARIEAEYLAEKAPQAERIEFNEETGKFFALPIDVAKPDLLGATLSQVQDALEDVLANPGNGISERSREARVLQRVFSKYGNDPQQIEMGFVSVHKGLTRQMVVGEDLPASEENLALMDALEEGAKSVRATHPEVAENRKIINEQGIKELPEGGLETLEEALPILVAISDEELANDWLTDIPQLINDATLPLPTGAPPLPGVDESMRIFSRAAQVSRKLRVDGLLTKIEESSGYRSARILGTLSGLVALGLSIFSVFV